MAYTDEQLRSMSSPEISKLMQTDVEAWRRAIELRYASEITPKLETKAAPQYVTASVKEYVERWVRQIYETIGEEIAQPHRDRIQALENKTASMAGADKVVELQQNLQSQIAALQNEIQELKNWKTQQERLQPAATTKAWSSYRPS